MDIFLDDEDALLQRLVLGEKEAVTFLFEKYYPDLLKASYAILGDREASKDVVQEVFAKIWEKRNTLQFKKPLKMYLFRAVMNHSLNYLRDYKTGMLSIGLTKSANYTTSPDITSEELEGKELETRIHHLIGCLPPQCKAVFQLSRNEELSNKEIAGHMEISIKAVEKHISKALKYLRKGLQPF